LRNTGVEPTQHKVSIRSGIHSTGINITDGCCNTTNK